MPGIHGLRGIAALAVLMFHATHIAKIPVPSPFSFIASDFGNGVHLFFVLSAFSLMHSTARGMHRTSWMTEYFVKRFFRIAPLFYSVVLGMVVWRSFPDLVSPGLLDSLFLNLTFTFAFAPWSGIVWAGWSVGVEMLFYAVFPVLLVTVRTRIGTLALVTISIVVAFASKLILQRHFAHTQDIYGYNWAHFSFAPNICYFALGMYAYRIASEHDRLHPTTRWTLPALTIVLFGVLLLGSNHHGWKPDLIIWGFGFAFLAMWQCVWPSRLCANGLLERLGERSYSIYLLHPILIFVMTSPVQSLYSLLKPVLGEYGFFACVAVILAPLLLVSELTYRLIEIPGIQAGQKIVACIKGKHVTEALLADKKDSVLRPEVRP